MKRTTYLDSSSDEEEEKVPGVVLKSLSSVIKVKDIADQ